MYKQSYKIESGKIEFVGEPIEVHKKVEYVINISNNESKKEVKMPKNECPKCLAKINALLANKESGFDEIDRVWLETLTEPQLDKAIKVKEVEKVVEKEVQVNVLSKEDQDALATYKKEKKEKRELLIKNIQNDSNKELWPDVVLNTMDDDTLKRIFDSVRKEEVTDYSVNSGSNLGIGRDEIEPLLPVGYGIETKK
jgi:thiol-disulfide isomerase/thioredoxin